MPTLQTSDAQIPVTPPESVAVHPDHAPFSVLRVTSEGHISYANPASRPVLAAWRCQVGDRLGEGWRKPVAEAIQSGAPVHADVVCDDWAMKLTFLATNHGAEGVEVYGQDITAQKHAEAISRSSRASFHSVVEKSPDGIIVVDWRGVVRYVNPVAVALFGAKIEGLVGEHFTASVVPGSTAEIDLVRQNGDAGVGELRVSETEWDETPARLVVIRDVTERKQALEAVHASEIQYRRLFESAEDGILVLDAATGLVLDVNPVLVERLGYSREALLDKKIWELGFAKDRAAHRARFAELQQKGQVRYDDLPLETAGGRPLEVEFISSVYQVGLKEVLRCNVRDITARRKAAQELRRAQTDLEQSNRDLRRRNKEIQAFYHTLSHELKTPLTSAREFVSIVMDGLAGPLSPTQLEYLGLAKEGCDQLRVYINDLLDVTRLETGKLTVQLKPVSVGRLVERIVQMMLPVVESKGIDLRADVTPDLPEATLDESRILQVLSNLLNNALKFTPAGGRIRVQAGRSPQRSNWLQMSVSDSGRGIPAEQQEHIFDRLYQVKSGDAATEGGLGLGLYICRELVELHGGTIWVESAPGHGSTFSFELPQNQRARQPQVLVVDDEPNLLTGCQLCLEREQFHVTMTGGGREALQQMRRQLPDVVLLDLQMPDLDGTATLKEIRKHWGAIPVILQTGYPDSDLMMRALQESPFTVLAKPCAVQQLLDAVRAAVASRKPRGRGGNAASPFVSTLELEDPPRPASEPLGQRPSDQVRVAREETKQPEPSSQS